LQLPAQKKPKQKGFFALLPSAFSYPFRGGGILVLVVGAILFGALLFLARLFHIGIAIVFGVVAIGYIFAYMQAILHSTAAGEEELPTLPGMTDVWQDVIIPFFQFLGLTLVCFGPAIALEWWQATSDNPVSNILVIGANILGCVYFPMAFLAVAMLDSVMAANPLVVIPSICKVPLEYLTTLIVLGLALTVHETGDQLLPLLFPRGVITHSMLQLLAMLSLQATWGVASLYLLAVNVRALGLLFVTSKEKLSWLRR